jgi:hypothetical protein
MNRDDIIRMAQDTSVHHINLDPDYIELLIEFAELVAAHEREACAQILDRNAAVCGNNLMLHDVLVGNALAIRARGQE